MSYMQFQQQCGNCKAIWNAAFGIVGTTQIAAAPTECPQCGSEDLTKIADSWDWVQGKTDSEPKPQEVSEYIQGVLKDNLDFLMQSESVAPGCLELARKSVLVQPEGAQGEKKFEVGKIYPASVNGEPGTVMFFSQEAADAYSKQGVAALPSEKPQLCRNCRKEIAVCTSERRTESPCCGWVHKETGMHSCDRRPTFAELASEKPSIDVAKEAREQELVELVTKVIAGLDAYCGTDGNEPYEGDECPHEYIGLDLLKQLKTRLADMTGERSR